MKHVPAVIKWLLVLPVAYFGSFFLAVLITPSGDPYAACLVSVALFAASVSFLIGFPRRGRSAPSDEGADSRPAHAQYSLRSLFALLTISALLFSWARISGVPHAVLGSLAAILLAIGGLVLNLLGAGPFGKPFAAASMMVLLACLLGGVTSRDYLLGGCFLLMFVAWACIAWRDGVAHASACRRRPVLWLHHRRVIALDAGDARRSVGTD